MSMRKTTKGIALLASSFVFLTSFLYAGSVAEAGDPAPDIGLEKLLQVPEGTVPSWGNLRGKIVVLEFWSTLCGPCVAAIPHLNELAEKFKDQPVQFIAITKEKEPIVARFLKEKPIKAWIGLDTDSSMFKAYGIKAIPRTVLVDKHGVLLGFTHPEYLTEKRLKDLVAGKKESVSLEDVATITVPDEVDSDEESTPLLKVVIRPTTLKSGGMISPGKKPKTFFMYGVPLKAALPYLYSIRSTRIVSSFTFPDDRYDFVVYSQEGVSDDIVRPILQKAVEAAFDLSIRCETREMDVYVLTAPKGRTPALREPANPSSTYAAQDEGKISVHNAPVVLLSCELEEVLKCPVFDESNLRDSYDIELTWDPNNPERIFDRICEQLGLELTSAKRPVEVLMIEKRKVDERRKMYTMPW